MNEYSKVIVRLLQRAGPTFAARWLALSAFANHAAIRWHAEIAEDDCARAKHALLSEATRLATPAVIEPVRRASITPLIGHARSVGLDPEDVLRTAYGSPARFWGSRLAEPMPLSFLAHLLATFASAPDERIHEFSNRTMPQWRIEHAWDNWIRAGELKDYRNSSGDRCLCDPCRAVELLAESPATEDLIPLSLTEFLTKEGRRGVKTPPTALERMLRRCVRKYRETADKPAVDECVHVIQSKLPEAVRKSIRKEYRRQANEELRRPADMPLKRGRKGSRKPPVNKQK